MRYRIRIESKDKKYSVTSDRVDRKIDLVALLTKAVGLSEVSDPIVHIIDNRYSQDDSAESMTYEEFFVQAETWAPDNHFVLFMYNEAGRMILAMASRTGFDPNVAHDMRAYYREATPFLSVRAFYVSVGPTSPRRQIDLFSAMRVDKKTVFDLIAKMNTYATSLRLQTGLNTTGHKIGIATRYVGPSSMAMLVREPLVAFGTDPDSLAEGFHNRQDGYCLIVKHDFDFATKRSNYTTLAPFMAVTDVVAWLKSGARQDALEAILGWEHPSTSTMLDQIIATLPPKEADALREADRILSMADRSLNVARSATDVADRAIGHLRKAEVKGLAKTRRTTMFIEKLIRDHLPVAKVIRLMKDVVREDDVHAKMIGKTKVWPFRPDKVDDMALDLAHEALVSTLFKGVLDNDDADRTPVARSVEPPPPFRVTYFVQHVPYELWADSRPDIEAAIAEGALDVRIYERTFTKRDEVGTLVDWDFEEKLLYPTPRHEEEK